MQVELDEHLQILLAVGSAVLCFLLAIGCIICCWHRTSRATDDKEAGLSVPPVPADHVTLTLSPAPSINTQPIQQQYEELDGDVLDRPSSHSSSAPSEDDVSCSSLPAAPLKSRFSLRRLSSPVVSSKPTKPGVRVRSSLPIIPKLSLKSQKRRNADDSGVSRTETVRLNAEHNRHYGSNSLKHTPSLQFPAKRGMRKSQSSHDALGSVGPERFLGRILILLQFQTPAHRVKVMMRKGENLSKLSRIPGTPEHYIIINLRQDGVVISTKETKCVSGLSPVWNEPFLFDLPAGDIISRPAGDIISRPPLRLEFVVMQGRRYTKSCILGRVLIGQECSEAGLRHWSEMCGRAPAETAFWHQLQPALD